MASPYLERLEQLRETKMQSQAEGLGLPLNKPMNGTPGGLAGNPMPDKPEEPGPDMGTMFGRTFQQMEGEDRRFGKMFKDLQNLSSGLREEVKQGFMPEVIAQQKIQQYIKDSQNWFSKNDPTMMDNPQMYNAIEGILSQKMGGGQPPQEGQPPQGGQPAAHGQAPTGGMV